MSFGSETRQQQTAFDFSEYLDGLYGYAVVLSRNATEAEDLVQETCLRALRSTAQLREDGKAKSWLFTILRNIWLNQIRHRRTTPEVAELDSDSGSVHEPADARPDPLDAYASKIERQQVRDAIQQLPVEFREVIILREYEELSYQQIAAVLGCPTGTVMSRLARARSRLRELLLERLTPANSEKGSNESNQTAA
jgi:RNA polymerase sigma-70 factor, ECF subfamily